MGSASSESEDESPVGAPANPGPSRARHRATFQSPYLPPLCFPLLLLVASVLVGAAEALNPGKVAQAKEASAADQWRLRWPPRFAAAVGERCFRCCTHDLGIVIGKDGQHDMAKPATVLDTIFGFSDLLTSARLLVRPEQTQVEKLMEEVRCCLQRNSLPPNRSKGLEIILASLRKLNSAGLVGHYW